MKKLLLLFLFPFISCDMSSTGVVAVVMSDDDVEYYSETEAEDELTETILELAQDYTKADFEDAKEYYADDAKVFFNSTEVLVIKSLKVGHMNMKCFDITITDEYAHTNYFTDGKMD